MNLFKKIAKWAGVTILVLFLGVVVYRGFLLNNQKKTDAVVAKIHATKLTLDDVMGKDLPPPPGDRADVTVVGVDANANGIRDDVELAIFEKYPNSAKKRAVSLQYALALQMEFTQPFVNTDIVVAVSQEGDRASLCTTEILSRSNLERFFKESDELVEFVEKLHSNTEHRQEFQKSFYDQIGSYSSLDPYCDIDYSKLPD
ncbi:MAG: hypothetical protein V4690_02305 [Patescibacteria group bacterium]